MSAQSMAPVSGNFPTDGSLHRLDIGISGNPAFAISRGSRGASSLTPEPDRRFPGMLLSPSPFGSGVSHWTQKPPFEFLPAELGIRRSASWRIRGLRRHSRHDRVKYGVRIVSVPGLWVRD